jgi:hypothetical protein
MEQAKAKATAVCTITGISLTLMDLPKLPFALEYDSPLGKYRNAIAIASLLVSELKEIATEVKAGVFLAMMNSCSLVEDHLPAVKRNNILSGIFTETSHTVSADLIHALRRIVECRSDKRWLSERLPHFAFSQETNLGNLEQYLEDCRDALYSKKEGGLVVHDILTELLEEERKLTAARKAEEKKNKPFAFTTSQKENIKRLASELKNAGVIGAKACSIFHHIATGTNVSLISEEQKARYIQFLTEKEDDAAESLAIIIGSIKINKNNNIEDEAESFQKPRKTLAQILEEVRQRKEAKKKGN